MCKRDENVSPYLRKRLRTRAEFLRDQDRKSRQADSSASQGTNSAPPVEPEASEPDADTDKETGSATTSGHGANDGSVKNTRRLTIDGPWVEGWRPVRPIVGCG